jgi:hypothetical protein
VITALLKLGTAQADVILNDWNTESCTVTDDDLDKTMIEVAKWTDVNDSKVFIYQIYFECQSQASGF